MDRILSPSMDRPMFFPVTPATAGSMFTNLLNSGPLYEIRDIPVKSKGAFATVFIAKGARILSEIPLVRWPRPKPADDASPAISEAESRLRLKNALTALTPEQQRTFIAIHNPLPECEHIAGIAKACVQLIGRGRCDRCICAEALKFNSACLPNAELNWNENIKRMTINATRDIAKGEEITVAGFPLTLMYTSHNLEYHGREHRRNELKKLFGLDCACTLCTMPESESAPVEQMLVDLCRPHPEGTPAEASSLSPLELLHRQYRILLLVDHAAFNMATAWYTYLQAFLIAIRHGDKQRAHEFVMRAWCLVGDYKGFDHEDHLDLMPLVEDVNAYSCPEVTTQDWADDAPPPRSLDNSRMDSWLWRLTPTVFPPMTQCADMRSSAFFPTFDELPCFDGCASEAQRIAKKLAVRAHWMLLGEVVEPKFTSHCTHVKMVLRDKAGTQFPLTYYVEIAAQGLVPKQLQRGWTVVVMYAEQHKLKSKEMGVVVNKPRFFKIFPVGLDDLLLLNDKVQKYAVQTENGLKTCQGCGKESASLRKCSRCQFFDYCDGACQLIGWNDKGHKADCKLLKDSDMHGLFRTNWAAYDGPRCFPL
ncbi:hypothetical protein ACHAQA_009434 [Verticillium albo-atrum]